VSQGPPARTAWVAIWNPPDDASPDDTMKWIIKDTRPSPTQRFQEHGSDADERRYASWYPETVQGRTQWSLAAYTVRRGTYVQITLISDDRDDLAWALTTWRSLSYRRES
jgi:hypothetical protein